MGRIYKYCCNRCGYELEVFEDSGMLPYSVVITDDDKDTYDGNFGEDVKNFFAEHPGGAIRGGSNHVMKCSECGELACLCNWTMHFTESGNPTLWREHGSIIVDSNEDDLDDECSVPYQHQCKKCGGRMEHVYEENGLQCPRCQSFLRREYVGFWY